MNPIAKLDAYINSVIPYAWDDSETWFEFLAKVKEKLNEIIAKQNEYFAVPLEAYTLGVLNQWREDGTLTAILSEFLDASVEEIAAMVTDKASLEYVDQKDIAGIVHTDTQIGALQTSVNQQIESFTNTAAGDIAAINLKVDSIVSPSPKNVFSSLAALQADGPANTEEGKKSIYLTSDNGSWYYWNGTAWTSGGVYQSSAIGDNSVNRQKLSQSFSYISELTSSDNLNTITRSGAYLASALSPPVNAPVPGSAVMYQINTDVVYAVQFYICFNLHEKFFFHRTIRFNNPEYNTPWYDLFETEKTKMGVDYAFHGIIGSSVDLNTIYTNTLKQGIYLIQDGNFPLNCPTIGTSILRVDNFSEGFSIQTLQAFHDPSLVFVRKVDKNNPLGITQWKRTDAAGIMHNSRVLFMGDSITATVPGMKKFDEYTNELIGINFINSGYAGSKFALIPGHEPYNTHSFFTKSTTVDISTSDYVFILYGVNDFNASTPIGSESTDEYTVCGALYKGIANLYARNPNLKILGATPFFFFTHDGTTEFNPDSVSNEAGLKMIDYVNAIKRIYNLFHIPVLDIWNEGGINAWNHHVYLPDLLHPNQEAHRLVAGKIAGFILDNR